jgi:ferritin-like metal-binding protein YciE
MTLGFAAAVRHAPHARRLSGGGTQLASNESETFPFTTSEDRAMKLHSLDDLFLDQLRDLYSAENQILKSLPRMAKAASSSELQGAFQQHLEQTRGHVERLDGIFEKLGASTRGRKCHAIEGMIEEAKGIINLDEADPDVRDAALIAMAQRVEHYEIAGYGCARTYARMLGDEESADQLQQTLNEEGETDKKLTRLAEEMVNLRAVGTAH